MAAIARGAVEPWVPSLDRHSMLKDLVLPQLQLRSLFYATAAAIKKKREGTLWSSLVAQQVEDPVLSFLWLRSVVWIQSWELLHAAGVPPPQKKRLIGCYRLRIHVPEYKSPVPQDVNLFGNLGCYRYNSDEVIGWSPNSV